MTRLTKELIEDICGGLDEYDLILEKNTGHDLKGIACHAAGLDAVPADGDKIKIRVVPVTSGLGIIPGFAESVDSIIRHLGFDSGITEGANVDGISKAVDDDACIIFMADDNRFIALNMNNKTYAENNYCTALGYVAALEKMAGDLDGKDVLVLGYGPVGQLASDLLTNRNAKVSVYDKINVEQRINERSSRHINLLKDLLRIKDYKYIIDATNEGSWIDLSLVNDSVCIAAPGVPFSFDGDACEYQSIRIVHDKLPIGVATMLMTCL